MILFQHSGSTRFKNYKVFLSLFFLEAMYILTKYIYIFFLILILKLAIIIYNQYTYKIFTKCVGSCEIYKLSVQKSCVFILCLNFKRLVSSLREFGKEFQSNGPETVKLLL